MSQIIMFPCGADTDFPGGVDGAEGIVESMVSGVWKCD